MPRIRSLKPEHKSSKKIGRLTHLAYRLWVALVTESDDEGRGEWDPEAFQHSSFAYQRITPRKLQEAMDSELVTADPGRSPLVYLYRPPGFPLLYQMHDWMDHQRVDNPTESKFPPPREDSLALASSREEKEILLPGSDRIGSDRRIGSELRIVLSGPQELADLYNTMTPDNVPSVQTLSPGRRVKCRKYLAMFPDRSWWEAVFEQYGNSRFLQGIKNSNGHESFTPDFDWLLSRGKDGTENCVKVHDGKYRD